jgi:hypothetical protein
MKLTPYEEQLIQQRRANTLRRAADSAAPGKKRKRQAPRPTQKKGTSVIGLFASELMTNALLLLLVVLFAMFIFGGW